MVGIYRTHEALEAAWKYFILGSVGIALALFGTILVYMAAQPVVGEGADAMLWTVLVAPRRGVRPGASSTSPSSSCFLGYGTKVGLAPLHAWLPDAHAEGPTPISAVLSGLLLNVALYAVLRFKMLLAGQSRGARAGPADDDDGPGLAGLRRLHALPPARHQAAVRLLSIEHMGIIAFAFGLGGPLANFAGLLPHGDALADQVRRSSSRSATSPRSRARRSIADHRPHRQPSAARLGAGARRRRHRRPAAARHLHERVPGRSPRPLPAQPLLVIPLVVGILVAFGALFLRLQRPRLRRADGPSGAGRSASYVPMFCISRWCYRRRLLPSPRCWSRWFQHVAAQLG